MKFIRSSWDVLPTLIRHVAIPLVVFGVAIATIGYCFYHYLAATSLITAIVWAICAINGFRLERIHRRRGWRLIGRGRDELRYEQWTGDQWVGFDIYAEHLAGNPSRILELWSSEEWESKTPRWGWGKREEILSRLDSECRKNSWAIRSR